METQEAVMTTQDIANRLDELFGSNNWQQIHEELFSDDAESIEPPQAQGMQSVKGKDAIKKKGEEWNQMVQEVHGGWCSKPIVGGRFISVAMGIDATMKGQGRSKMEEIVV